MKIVLTQHGFPMAGKKEFDPKKPDCIPKKQVRYVKRSEFQEIRLKSLPNAVIEIITVRCVFSYNF